MQGLRNFLGGGDLDTPGLPFRIADVLTNASDVCPEVFWLV